MEAWLREGLIALLAICSSTQAIADTLVATRPGLMCSGAWALAVLTLPDGSSRAASSEAHRDDALVKQRGGCVDFAPGFRPTLVLARFNTSVVTVVAPDGKVATFTVPNIDFKRDQASFDQTAPAGTPSAEAAGENPLPGLATARDFFARLTADCPQQGWTENRLTHMQNGPVDAVYEQMSKAQQRAAQNEADTKCEDVPGLACPTDTVFGFMVRAGHLDEMVKAACGRKAR